jgi:hypothetical protein
MKHGMKGKGGKDGKGGLGGGGGVEKPPPKVQREGVRMTIHVMKYEGR